MKVRGEGFLQLDYEQKMTILNMIGTEGKWFAWMPNEEQTVQNIQVLHVCSPTGTVKWSENLILSKNLTKTQHLIPKYNLQPYFKLSVRLSPFPCTLTECSAARQISLCLTWNKNMLASLLINPNRNTHVHYIRMVANSFLRLFSHYQKSDSNCYVKNCVFQ